MSESFEIVNLEKVVDFVRGLTYKKKDETEFSNNVVLRANNIDVVSNKLDFTELKYIKDEIKIPPSKIVKRNTLIICTASGSKKHLGKVALIDKDYNYAFGGFMGLLIPRENIFPKFLFYVLISDTYRTFIDNLTAGVNINNLRFDLIRYFKIPLPPLPEQKRIVKILDKAFAAIEKAKTNTEKNLQNTRELFDSYLNKIFTNPGEDWEEKTIQDVCCDIFAGGDAPKDNFSKEKNEKYRVPIFANAVKDNGLYGYTDFYRVTEPSITIAARGSGTGHTEIRNESFLPIVRLIVLIPNLSLVTLEFLKHSIDNLEILRSGSAIPQLTVPMIKEYKIPLPNLSEQQTIVKKLDSLSAETRKLETIYQQKLKDLEELKKSILQKAFSGQLL